MASLVLVVCLVAVFLFSCVCAWLVVSVSVLAVRAQGPPSVSSCCWSGLLLPVSCRRFGRRKGAVGISLGGPRGLQVARREPQNGPSYVEAPSPLNFPGNYFTNFVRTIFPVDSNYF